MPDTDPLARFRAWLDEARAAASLPDPTAMVLATATPDGAPSARVVLLKDVDARGFVFYTNYDSRKGRELAGNARAALVFHWPAVARQVRVEGEVERLPETLSDAYFATRPVHHRVSAWASPQSAPIESRAWLEQRVADTVTRWRHGDIPRPPHWGGYRLVPARIEFWHNRPNRLHERIRFTRAGDVWRQELLAP